MYFLYSLLLTVGVVALLPRFVWDALRHGKYAAGLGERAGEVPMLATGGRPVVWLHCVSVGETQAARPLVRALLDAHPSHALVVSTTTLTGQRVAREVFGPQAAAVFYFPFDWAWAVRRTLRRIKPSVVLVMETELWPRFFRECRARRVPVALVNGRISPRSFRNYKLIHPFIKRVVGDLALACMQTEADAERLAALGLARERLKVSGNIKFDAGVETSAYPLTTELRARFGFDDARPLILAASTHSPEERVVLEAFKRTRATLDGTKPRLLIAPRHPERFDEVAALLETSGLTWTRRSAPPAAADKLCDAVLLDTIGELRAAYPLASLVFVGGSIARTGGHNVLEPALEAKCIITGAHTFNFAAIVRAFLEHDALVQLPDADDASASVELARAFQALLADHARRERLGANARAALERNRGATARTIELLAPLFDEETDDNKHQVLGLPLHARADV